MGGKTCKHDEHHVASVAVVYMINESAVVATQRADGVDQPVVKFRAEQC